MSNSKNSKNSKKTGEDKNNPTETPVKDNNNPTETPVKDKKTICLVRYKTYYNEDEENVSKGIKFFNKKGRELTVYPQKEEQYETDKEIQFSGGKFLLPIEGFVEVGGKKVNLTSYNVVDSNEVISYHTDEFGNVSFHFVDSI